MRTCVPLICRRRKTDLADRSDHSAGAALPCSGELSTFSVSEIDRALDINLRTAFLASKYAIPVMAAKGSGSIVNISSISALRLVAGVRLRRSVLVSPKARGTWSRSISSRWILCRASIS